MSNATLRPPVSTMPTVPTTFTADSGSATPALNNLNVFGGNTVTNNDNGITTSGAASTLNIQLTNRATGATTTADATPISILTIPLGATPATFLLFGNVQAFNASTPSGASYSVNAAFRTDGITATFIAGEFDNIFEDADLVNASASLDALGNSVVLSVQGIAGTNINWNSILEYRMVT